MDSPRKQTAVSCVGHRHDNGRHDDRMPGLSYSSKTSREFGGVERALPGCVFHAAPLGWLLR